MKESEIIQKYFLSQIKNPEIINGIGDDAAVVDVAKGYQLVTSMDTLVADVHFFSDQNPDLIAYKSLAVNLSDMAAMAAVPKAYLLSLTLPTISESWLATFSKGLSELSQQFNVDLIGGDLSKGALSISITILGLSKADQYISRFDAKPGDNIYVSGNLGDAGLALELIQNKKDASLIQDKLFKPVPRIDLAQSLIGIANSMIDISDGLILDLERILIASNVGANITLDSLPLSETILELTERDNAIRHALSSGDDYELCFTVPASKIHSIEMVIAQSELPITCIGKITKENELVLVNKDGDYIENKYSGHEHFE